MRLIKTFLHILIIATSAFFVVPLSSCENKKTREEIEADFKDNVDLSSEDNLETSEKQHASYNNDLNSVKGELPSAEEESKKKAAEEAKANTATAQPVQEASAVPTEGVSVSETTTDNTANVNREPAKPATPVATQPSTDKPASPAVKTEPARTSEPANRAEPAKATPAKTTDGPRQPDVIQKTEPKRNDKVVDGQAQ